MSVHDQWEEAERWFAFADLDIRTARVCMAASPPLLGSAAYHCQQAAEKLIKDALVSQARPVRKTHDLGELADEVGLAAPAVAPLADRVRSLTTWGVAHRYLGAEAQDDEPVGQKVSDALSVLDALQAAVLGLKP